MIYWDLDQFITKFNEKYKTKFKTATVLNLWTTTVRTQFPFEVVDYAIMDYETFIKERFRHLFWCLISAENENRKQNIKRYYSTILAFSFHRWMQVFSTMIHAPFSSDEWFEITSIIGRYNEQYEGSLTKNIDFNATIL